MSITIRTVGIQTTTLPDGSKAVVHFDNTTSAPVIQPEPPDPIVPPATTGRSVVIEIGGTTHTFNQYDGLDMGDYVDPAGRFTQLCTRCTNAALPAFTVWFRPDADGLREEVVFELGHIWPATPAANLGAYVAYIYKDDVQLTRVDVPHHNYFGRWRWQSAVRMVATEVADLISQGLLPRYDAEIAGGFTPPSNPQHYAGPMDLAGITPYMPQTGGRDDIGLVTECQADYLCTQSEAALNSLRAQLEGCGTLTWHYRDENTGAPLDTYAYPRASSYDPYNQGPDPYIPLTVGDGGGITLDTSHEPDLAYVPYLLTGDPYALEEMQFTVTYNVIKVPPNDRGTYNMGGALRAHAWALRCMARCARVTPDAVPQWLMPRSHFQQMMDGNREFVAGYANSAETLFTNLHNLADPRWGAPPETNIPPDCSNAPWWEDYEQAVMGHVIEMGFTDWMPNYQWKVQNIIERCNGTSGWVRNNAFPYKIAVRETAASPWVANWQACWELNVKMGVVVDTGQDHIPAGDLSYPQQGLAALAIAKRLGIEGAAAAHTWLQDEVDALSTPSNFIYARWAIS
jgi:hypothetical protein